MPVIAKLFWGNFQPVEGDPADVMARINAAQVFDEQGTLLAKASRVYRSWFFTVEGDTSSVLVEDVGMDDISALRRMLHELSERLGDTIRVESPSGESLF